MTQKVVIKDFWFTTKPFNMYSFYKITLITGIFCLICSCEEKKEGHMFEQKETAIRLESNIDKQHLARVEAIHCNDSVIVVSDYHSGKSFSLFNRNTEEYLGRFGTIGQAPMEIQSGCFGSVIDQWFYIHDSASLGIVAKYSLNDLMQNIDAEPIAITQFKSSSKNIYISETLPVNDSLFLSAGLYISTTQYFLFDKKSMIVGYGVKCYEEPKESSNFYHKALSNQGKLRKHPTRNRFAYFVRNSSNIDFIEVEQNEIKPIKLQRERNPRMKSAQNGQILAVYPDEKSKNGYLDISAGEKYLYALHTDKEVTQPYNSNVVRVFDWDGNPIKQIELDSEAYYIAVDEKNGKLYAAIQGEDKGWEVALYDVGN